MSRPERTGGFYSKADIRALVARAGRFGIEVIPEIDVPGSMPRCIRVMIHCYMPRERTPHHVYLRDAVRLRADLTDDVDVQ